MFYLRRVVGHSMVPTLRPNQLVVFVKRKAYKTASIVLYASPTDNREYVKRLSLQKNGASLSGDNQLDSLNFSGIAASDIRGALLWPREK